MQHLARQARPGPGVGSRSVHCQSTSSTGSELRFRFRRAASSPSRFIQQQPLCCVFSFFFVFFRFFSLFFFFLSFSSSLFFFLNFPFPSWVYKTHTIQMTSPPPFHRRKGSLKRKFEKKRERKKREKKERERKKREKERERERKRERKKEKMEMYFK